MQIAYPLPNYLVERFKGWHATSYQSNRAWFRNLAEHGQNPRAMVISCCDSRVHAISLFKADAGEFFSHRNIANLVPPYNPDGKHHGTSAAIEYAVKVLHVAHIIVLGHSNCGGVKGCLDLCSGKVPELEKETSFVGQWVSILRPGYERIKNIPKEDQITALEKEAVVVSLENLMTFPFIKGTVDVNSLTLHGLWNNIGEGVLEQYTPEVGFTPI